jgi:hypothetical protein
LRASSQANCWSHREHPAEEVYVTGTFDNWTKSIQLEKKGDVFEKTVDLKDASSKIYYKVRLSATICFDSVCVLFP